MLNISCTYCRAPIAVSDAELAQIMQDAGKKPPKSVPIVCNTCRRANKLATKRVEQAYRLAGSPPAPPPAVDDSLDAKP